HSTSNKPDKELSNPPHGDSAGEELKAATTGSLMHDSRLTHGGFYRHFASKEELFTEAFAQGLEELNHKLLVAIERAPGGGELKALIDYCLDIGTPTISLVVVRLRPWQPILHGVHPKLVLISCGS